MVKFNDEHKKDNMGGDFIPEGVHKVKIVDINFDKDTQDREYVEFTVADEENRAGTARMWFTTDAAIGYTFSIIRGIFVHNAPEGKKDEIREQIDKMTDSAELEKACKVLIGKEAWYQVVKTDRTYETTDKDGNPVTRNSYNRNLYGYEPTPKRLSSDPAPDNTKPIKTTNAAGEEVEIADF